MTLIASINDAYMSRRWTDGLTMQTYTFCHVQQHRNKAKRWVLGTSLGNLHTMIKLRLQLLLYLKAWTKATLSIYERDFSTRFLWLLPPLLLIFPVVLTEPASHPLRAVNNLQVVAWGQLFQVFSSIIKVPSYKQVLQYSVYGVCKDQPSSLQGENT